MRFNRIARVLLLLLQLANGEVTFTHRDRQKVLNPERGLYTLCDLTDPGPNYVGYRTEYGVTLCYAPIRLDQFRTSPISPAHLDLVTTKFQELRLGGLKAIPRVVYNDDAGGQDTTLEWIEEHLRQLQPVFEDNKDVIAYFKGGIIGAWGEWHSSATGLDTPTGRASVWSLLHQYLPTAPCLKVMIRRPDFVFDLVSALPITEAEAHADSCTEAQRIAHHNDCFLALRYPSTHL